eukprot:6195907-Pleurochrysis_carterae.AAC.2
MAARRTIVLTAACASLATTAAVATTTVKVGPAISDSAFRTAASLCLAEMEESPSLLPFLSSFFGPQPSPADELAEKLRERCRSDQHSLLLASVPGADEHSSETLLGCVEVGMLPPPPTRPGPDVPYIANLVVAEYARRSGVGAQLIVESEALCLRWAQPRLYCKVARDNIAARRLYDRCGFRPIFIQTLRSDWRNRQAANIFMVKELQLGDGEASPNQLVCLRGGACSRRVVIENQRSAEKLLRSRLNS